jgi:copper chaperone CopZ
MSEHIKIEGMGCDHCVASVKKALGELDCLKVIQVVIGDAEVEFLKEGAREQAKAAIEDCGFDVVG